MDTDTVTVRLTDGTRMRFSAYAIEIATFMGRTGDTVEADATLLNVVGRARALGTLLSGAGGDADVRETWEAYLDTIAAYLLPCYARDVDHVREFLRGESLAAARTYGLFIRHDLLDEMGDDLVDSLRRKIGKVTTSEDGALFEAAEVTL